MKSMISGTIEGTKHRAAPAMRSTSRGLAPADWRSVMPDHSIPSTTEDTTESGPYGHCHCGCGRKTTINPHSWARKGLVKGEPARFISGHNARPKGWSILVPEYDEENRCVRIPLYSTKHRNLVALVDTEDVDVVWSYRWYPKRSRESEVFYALSTDQSLHMHRLILDSPSGMDADHINGNGLDNRRSNLRSASRADNNRNKMKSRVHALCPFTGVSLAKSTGRWAAIGRDDSGRRKHIGYFATDAEAAIARDAFVRRTRFASFSRYNFPLPGELPAVRPENEHFVAHAPAAGGDAG